MPTTTAARLCHASNTFLCLTSGWSANRLFSQMIREITNWLNANPGEVLIVKLDDHLNDLDTRDHSASILDPIQTYLGSRVYRGPGTAATLVTWPTMAEMKQARKQIIFISRNSTIGDGTWILEPKYFPTADHPQDANFDNCTDAEGVSNFNRTTGRFTLVSEGRSMSNLAESTGLLDPDTIRKAAACGFSAVTLDFVNALAVPVWGYSQTDPDRRREAAIWSWAPNDRGARGPAWLRSGDGRWEGRPVGETHRYACAISTRSTSSFFQNRQNRQWKITRASGSWGIVNGDNACKAEYPGWEFAFPANGYQNDQLARVLAASSSSDGLWLKYNSADFQPLPEPSAGPAEIVFVISPGDTVMPSTQVMVSGVAGATIQTQVRMGTQAARNWLQAPLPGGTAILGNDPYPLTISIGEGAKQLPVNFNDYLGEVQIGYASSIPGNLGPNFQYGQIIRVRLQVRTATTTQLLLDPAVPIENQPFRILGRVTSLNTGLPVQGRITGYDVTPPADPNQPVIPAPFETREFCGTSTNSQTITAASITRPAGKYSFSISYEDAGNCSQYSLRSSETGPVEVNVVPRLSATPASLRFSTVKGFSAPKQTFSVVGVNGNAKFAVVEGADLFTVEALSSSTGSVALTTAAIAKAPGVYSGRIEIADSNGTSSLPLELTVLGILSQPSTVSLLAANTAVFKSVPVTSSDPIPFTVTGNAAWLILPPGGITGQTIQAGANPAGLAPGTYRGTVTISAPLAKSSVSFRVDLEVVRATNIVSSPAGLKLTIDGQEFTAPASFAWRPNTVHTLSAPGPQAGPSGTRFRFESWSDGGAVTHSFTATANGGDVKALYRRQFQVTTAVSPSGAGAVTVQPASTDGFYDENEQVTFTAAPSAGFAFLNWSGSLSGNQSPLAVRVTGAVATTATFNRATVKLSIQSKTAHAAITLNGVEYAVPAVIPLESGQVYKLAAVSPNPVGPGTRIVFESWSNGGPIAQDFTAPNTDASITVNYRTEYLITALVSPANSGTVTGAGWYAANSTATLNAAPAAGFAFSNFSGATTTKTNPLPAQVTGSQTYVANFAPAQQPSLYATVGAGRADGPQPGQRVITLRLNNAGPGGAGDVSVFEISGITVVDGSGAVSIASPVPVGFGTIVASQSANGQVIVNWPTSATRVRFNFRFAANGGSYIGATALTLSR